MRRGLSGTRSILARLGHPERSFASVLVGGTNGKGSTAAVLERVLREAGYRTGLYTSPHLVHFRERIRVEGRAIRAPHLDGLLRAVVPYALRNRHSFFEAATAMAFEHFRNEGVEIAVLEVGLGGRLDCTNVADPLVSVITGISLEHTEWLGKTLEKIAYEKAGIAREGRPVVIGGSGRSRTLLEAQARRRGARVVRASRAAGLRRISQRTTGMRLETRTGAVLRCGLVGEHQVSNVECALAALRELEGMEVPIGAAAVRRGLAAARWPARFEWLPESGVVLDAAHNPEAARAFAATWREVIGRKGVGVVGVLSDKDAAGILRALRGCARLLVLTTPPGARSLTGEALRAFAGRVPCAVEPNVRAALKRAMAERARGERIFVTGSLYTLGAAIPALGHRVPDAL